MEYKNNPGNLKRFKGSYMCILNVLDYYITQNDLTSNVFLGLKLKSVKFPAFLLKGGRMDYLFMPERNQLRLHV